MGEPYPDPEVTHASEAGVRLGSVAAGEQAVDDPMLIHFYGYCDYSGVDVHSTAPQDGPRLASAIHGYLLSAIDDLNARRGADHKSTKSQLLRVPPEMVELRLRAFYDRHGAELPSDSFRQAQRLDYLEEGIHAAQWHRNKYPEIGLIEALAERLQRAGHTTAAQNAMVLLAVTGASLNELHEY